MPAVQVGRFYCVVDGILAGGAAARGYVCSVVQQRRYHECVAVGDCAVQWRRASAVWEGGDAAVAHGGVEVDVEREETGNEGRGVHRGRGEEIVTFGAIVGLE